MVIHKIEMFSLDLEGNCVNRLQHKQKVSNDDTEPHPQRPSSIAFRPLVLSLLPIPLVMVSCCELCVSGDRIPEISVLRVNQKTC